MTEEHLNCSLCPNCAGKLRTASSRQHLAFGFTTVKRRKICPECDYRIFTIELPAAVADDVFRQET
jgi:transcriptional regulator NrdR family protein